MKIAAKQLEEFCKMLELEGITVRRPDNIDHSFEYQTPDFKSTGMLPQPISVSIITFWAQLDFSHLVNVLVFDGKNELYSYSEP